MMKFKILTAITLCFSWQISLANSLEWTTGDQEAFKESARVIEIFKLDLEFVQSLGRVMGRAPQYANRNAKQAEEKVLSDIAAAYYDALKTYSKNTTTFLSSLVETLDQQKLNESFAIDSSVWRYPIPKEAQYSWFEGLGDLAVTGVAGAVAMGSMDDGLEMTAGALAGANFIDFLTGFPGVNSDVQEQTLEVMENDDGDLQHIGVHAKKIHDLSVKYAISRVMAEEIKVELTYYTYLVDQLDQSAQKLSDLIAILNYGTNEAAYEAIKEMIREGKKTNQVAAELKSIAMRLGLKTKRYKNMSKDLIVTKLYEKLEGLHQTSRVLYQTIQRNDDIFEIILDTSKNVEIVQFFLSKS